MKHFFGFILFGIATAAGLLGLSYLLGLLARIAILGFLYGYQIIP